MNSFIGKIASMVLPHARCGAWLRAYTMLEGKRMVVLEIKLWNVPTKEEALQFVSNLLENSSIQLYSPKEK